MQHGREEISVERRMPKAPLKTIALNISTLGVDFGEAELLLRWVVVAELMIEGPNGVDFVRRDDEDRWDAPEPL